MQYNTLSCTPPPPPPPIKKLTPFHRRTSDKDKYKQYRFNTVRSLYPRVIEEEYTVGKFIVDHLCLGVVSLCM
jgi:hypothetical protein